MIATFMSLILSQQISIGYGRSGSYVLGPTLYFSFDGSCVDCEGIVMLADTAIGAEIDIDGTKYQVKEETKLIRIRDFPAKFTVSKETTATAWLIPKEICDGPIVGHLSDNPRFSLESTDASYSKLCYFPMRDIGLVTGDISYSNSGGQTELYFRNDFLNGGRTPRDKCSKSCSKSLGETDYGIIVSYSTSNSATYKFDADYRSVDEHFPGNDLYVGVAYSKSGVDSFYITNTTKYSTGRRPDGEKEMAILIGCIVGAVVLIIVIIAVVVFFVIKKKKAKQNQEAP